MTAGAILAGSGLTVAFVVGVLDVRSASTVLLTVGLVLSFVGGLGLFATPLLDPHTTLATRFARSDAANAFAVFAAGTVLLASGVLVDKLVARAA
ncbi:MAG: hypothetical protein ABEJ90_04255 [Halobacterium sp.]